MNRKAIEEKIIEILADILVKDKNKINTESRLVEDLEADSFSAVEILYAIKEKFRIQIPQKALAKAYTVKDIVNYLEKRIDKKK